MAGKDRKALHRSDSDVEIVHGPATKQLATPVP